MTAIGWWLEDYGKVLVVVSAIALLFVGIGIFAMKPFEAPAETEKATVVRFGSYNGRYGSGPVVIVRTRDGSIRQLLVGQRRTRNCRAGDTIHLVRRGDALFVHTQGCTS